MVVELFDDGLFGWALRQARLSSNAPVAAETRAEITAALRATGVHVGRSAWGMVRALQSARYGRPLTTVEETVGWCYGDDD